MRRVFLLVCLVSATALAQPPVHLRVQPSDATVWVQRPGFSAERLGSAQESLSIPPEASRLILKRPGWQDLEVPASAAAGDLRLTPGTSPGDRINQAGYYLGQLLLPGLGLAVVVGGLVWLRRKPAGPDPRDEKVAELVAGVTQAQLTGLVMGGYRLLDTIGEGGMGQIYRGLPTDSLDLSQAVAVKVLHQEYSEDSEYRKRFLREAQICQAMEHPGLIRTLGFGEAQGRMFLAMELLQGETLDQVLARERRLPVRQAVDYVAQAMRALQVVHSNGITHRDLKPDNLFILAGGRVKVTDFGVARGDQYTVATSTGLVMGTPEYMAPEQIHGEVHVATDQYALGVVLYELVAGVLPYDDENPMAVVGKHCNDPIPSARERNPEVPEKLDAVIRKLLAKHPRDRYPDMQAAADALQASV